MRVRIPATTSGTIAVLVALTGFAGRATATPPAPVPVANPVVEASTVAPPAPTIAAPSVEAATSLAPITSAPTTTRAPIKSLRINGHGYGHGRGLGQWGAFGYATKLGWPYARILEHFYGNTVPGRVAPTSSLGVRLTAFDGKPIVVMHELGWLYTQFPGQAAAPPGGPTTTTVAPTAAPVGAIAAVVESAAATSTTVPAGTLRAGPAAVRVQLTGAGWVISDGPGCAGPWVARPVVAAPNVLVSVGPQETLGDGDPARLLQLCAKDGREVYRGEILAADGGPDGRQGQFTVNQLGLEDYLRGVIPREIPAGWGDRPNGIEALKAQVVAARSYASAERRTGFSNTCDTTACQVYRGRGTYRGAVFASNEDPRTDRAVVETAGEVRVDPKTGAPIRTEFSASTGGHTAPGEFPDVVDEGDDVPANPHRSWTVGVSAARLESGAKGLGPFVSAQVVEADGKGLNGGRALRVKLAFAKGEQVLTGADVTKRFGLRSNYFALEVLSGEVAVDSSGAVVAVAAGDPVDAVLGVPVAVDTVVPTAAVPPTSKPSAKPKRKRAAVTSTVVVSPSAIRAATTTTTVPKKKP